MLLRILTIATVSMTYLSVQALSSTETKSQRFNSPAMLTKSELAELPTPDRIAQTTKHQASLRAFPPLPQSYRIAQLNAKKNKHSRTANNKVGKNAKQKIFVRLSYMPPSYIPSSAVALKSKRRKLAKQKQQRIAAINTIQLNKTAEQPKPVSKIKKPKYSLGAAQTVKKVKKPVSTVKKAKAKRTYRKRRYRSTNYMAAITGGF